VLFRSVFLLEAQEGRMFRPLASTEEKPTARVLVQARGRNIRPSCASRRKTGRNDTTIMRSEKKIAGPTCLAASSRILRRSRSVGSRSGEETLLGGDTGATGPFVPSHPGGVESARYGCSDRCR